MPDKETMIIDELTQVKIKHLFVERCKEQNIKFASKSFYREQASFVAGVSAAFLSVGFTIPPYWSIACMTDREIVDKF